MHIHVCILLCYTISVVPLSCLGLAYLVCFVCLTVQCGVMYVEIGKYNSFFLERENST